MNIFQKIKNFRRNTRGSAAVIFGVAAIPMVGVVGAAVDLARTVTVAQKLQTAVDAGTMAGAILTLNNRDTHAKNVFLANLGSGTDLQQPSASFQPLTRIAIGTLYSGTASVTVPTVFLKVLGYDSIRVTRRAEATFATGDNSCILTLGGELDLEDATLTFNGAPAVNLTGCSLRSNKSMKCNGNDVGATASIATGAVEKCPNPQSYVMPLPDIYAPIVDKPGALTKACSSDTGNVTWDGTGLPIGPYVINRSNSNYNEIHICGNLVLTGVGALGGTSTSRDTVIIVENGDVKTLADSNLVAQRTTIVMTSGSEPRSIDFPMGNGHSASLQVSAGKSQENPFAGIALYQDPRATSVKSVNWRPAATMITDGITYLPKTSLTLSGNAKTGPSACSKLVTHTFRINGDVSLKQNASGCKDGNVTQYLAWPRLWR